VPRKPEASEIRHAVTFNAMISAIRPIVMFSDFPDAGRCHARSRGRIPAVSPRGQIPEGIRNCQSCRPTPQRLSWTGVGQALAIPDDFKQLAVLTFKGNSTVYAGPVAAFEVSPRRLIWEMLRCLNDERSNALNSTDWRWSTSTVFAAFIPAW
jgi:hypothetical protein